MKIGGSRGLALVLSLAACGGSNGGSVDVDASTGGGSDAPVSSSNPGMTTRTSIGTTGEVGETGTRGDTGPATDDTGELSECAEAPDAAGAIRVREGSIAGKLRDGVHSFLGIPFAAPPVNELRWEPPAPVDCYTEVRAADQWAPACLQVSREGDGIEGSEDCLYLNVWTPDARPTGDRPVFVFIHGGGNMFGSASTENSGVLLYEGEELARRSGAVVVTLQYRLNIFGFAVDGALEDDGLSGNYGLRDQIAALTWVQDNIASFGGDPAKVALAGESGGASDVCAHLASPESAGLFAAAIVQSGGCRGKVRAGVQAWTDGVFEAAGCPAGEDRLSCVRALDAVDLAGALANEATSGGVATTPVGPTIGDAVVPVSPQAAFEAGTHNPVPVIIGSNADETASPMFGVPPGLTEAAYAAAVSALFGPASGAVLAEYPVTEFSTPRAAWIAVTTDAQFTCPTRTFVRALLSQGVAPVYRFFYTHTLNGTAATAALGAAHGLELFFLFQTMDRLVYPATDGDRELEASILEYWISLAATGSPNTAGSKLPLWPEATLDDDLHMELAAPASVGNGVRSDRCDFWEGLAPGP